MTTNLQIDDSPVLRVVNQADTNQRSLLLQKQQYKA